MNVFWWIFLLGIDDKDDNDIKDDNDGDTLFAVYIY